MKHPHVTTEYLSDGIALKIQFKLGRPWVKKKFPDDKSMEEFLIKKGMPCYV